MIYVAKRQGLIEADQEINCISQLSHDGTCPHHSIPGSSICTEKSTWYCSPSVNQFGKYSLTMEPLSFAKRILWHTWNSILTDDGLDCSSEPILSIWRSTELRKGYPQNVTQGTGRRQGIEWSSCLFPVIAYLIWPWRGHHIFLHNIL